MSYAPSDFPPLSSTFGRLRPSQLQPFVEEADEATPRPDWSRERMVAGTSSPVALLASLRAYQAARRRGGLIGGVQRRWAVLRHRWWSVLIGVDIPINCRIGGGLLLPHPNGIVIHPDATIGVNCLIFQQVTIGMAAGGVPRIGHHVDIGAGAKVLGRIRIGDHAKIGANAVVLQDVPAGATAVGIPARIVLRSR